MREKWRAGCVARTAETTSTTLAAAAPTAHLLPGQNRLTCPCQAQNAKTRRRRAARALEARRRRSPDPTDALAHRNNPHAGPRSLPTSAWIGFALLYSRLPEKGTKLKPWGAAMIKNKTMGMMPRLGAIQWCRLRRDLPSRSLAPAMRHQRRRIGDRHFES